MADYSLTIVSPSGKIFDGNVESLVASGEEGFFGVLADHAPMIAALRPGVLSVTQSGSTAYYAVGPGLLEVNEGKVNVIADSAEKADSEADARKRLGIEQF